MFPTQSDMQDSFMLILAQKPHLPHSQSMTNRTAVREYVTDNQQRPGTGREAPKVFYKNQPRVHFAPLLSPRNSRHNRMQLPQSKAHRF